MTAKKIPHLHEVEQKIRQLNGPLTVTLARYTSGKTTPLSMFTKPGSNGPGRDFLPEEVLAIHEGVLEWAGGGNYVITVTDVDGTNVQFQLWFSEEQFPQKTPPPMVASSRAGQVIQMPVAPQPQPQVQYVQQQQPVAAMGGGGPAMSFDYVQSGVPTRQVTPAGPQPVAPTWMTGVQAAPTEVRVYEKDRSDERRARGVEEELRREREERMKLEGKIERDRIEAAGQAQLTALREELRRLSEKGQANPAESDALRRVVEQNEALVREMRELREAKREESTSSAMTSMVTMIMNMQQQSQAQMVAMMQAMQQSTQQMIAAISAKPSGPDPVISVIVENNRQQMDAMKELVRGLGEQQREASRNAMGPRDLVDLTEKMRASSGADQLLKSVTEAYQNVLGMTKQSMELMKEMSGGPAPHPALEMVGAALQGIQGIAQRYIAMKQQVDVANAQARAVEAQAIGRTMPPGQPLHQPQQPGAQPQAVGEPPSNVVPIRPGAATQLTEIERQLFGIPQVMEAVERLRLSVAQGTINPAQAANWVNNAVLQITQMGGRPHVKVLKLLEEGMFDDFVRALLPHAPQPFVIEFVQILSGRQPAVPPAAAQQQDPEEEEDDEDEDDEEENEP